LGFLVYRIGHGIGRAFAQVLAEFDITPAHFGVLNAIDAYGLMHQQHVARLLGINRQTVVNVVNELERRALVERRRLSHDRRAYGIYLTATGQHFVQDVDQAAVQIEQRIFATFSPDEQQQLYALLYRLATSGQFGDLLSATGT
jgi:DNA-binding MarR family transcriptional regulator